ncbi:MAG: alanyl-tRNA editing protein [Eubacteriaceae bacterium]|nr:alanyl-tRNA editing protein [Eubacteriaceae bacterium]
MLTERLYEEDSHIREFSAVVREVRDSVKGGYDILLDKTAFFPGGGGQDPDEGTLDDIFIDRAFMEGEEIWHHSFAKLKPGQTVSGRIDWDKRFSRMQNHSGEHILSGLIHNRYGYENVGFHMGEAFMEIDFSGVIPDDDIRVLEDAANDAVCSNVPVSASFPGDEELAVLDYRSKKDLEGQKIRIVRVTGIDACACCAPHVAFTGEIGVIRIIGTFPKGSGTRLHVICGLKAFNYLRDRNNEFSAIARSFSTAQEEAYNSVIRLKDENEELKRGVSRLSALLAEKLTAEMTDITEKNAVLFVPKAMGMPQARDVAVFGAARYSGVCAVFCGSDREGWRYVIASGHIDLKAAADDINSAINGHGGGKSDVIQGTCSLSETKLRRYFSSAELDAYLMG